MKEAYQEMENRHHEELNSFDGVFFAFSEKQFNEGMKKIGLDPFDTDKIYNLGNTGGYILKERSPAYRAMFDRHEQELAERMKDKDFFYKALVYELCNHEYCYTNDHTDALYALGINEEDIDTNVLIKACKEANTDI
jgi:hypothetical protein